MTRDAALVTLVVLSPILGFAQETTGSIVGTVRSGDGAPVAGVSVVVEDLDRGLRWVAQSDQAGDFGVAALPPASYRLTASRQGFSTVTGTARVELGRTVAIRFEMPVGTFTDSIEVTGGAPLVDPRSTTAGLTADVGELLARVPVEREATEIALLAPGTFAADSLWQEPGWYGIFTPGQGFVSIGGASFGENSYLVNGLNITNFRQMVGSSFVPLEFVDEVQVKTGGWQAEFGRATGGVINMVTKRGTNALRGDLSLYWEPEGLQEQDPDTYWRDNQEEGREDLEANASLGGPVVRDRLFFFGFLRYNDTWATDYYGPTAVRLESSAPYWGAKVDWSPSSRHRFDGTYFSDAVDVDSTTYEYDQEARALLGERGTSVYERGGGNAILGYNGLVTSHLLLSAQAGRNEFDRTQSSAADACPLALDRRGGTTVPLGCWVNLMRGANSDTRDAYRADLDVFAGKHSLRAGADYEHSVASATQDYSGGVGYVYYLNGSPEQTPEEYVFPGLPWDTNLVLEATYITGGDYHVYSRAAYLQDSWAVTPELTLNLGLRWEAYENTNGTGGAFIETDDQWAPRLGAVWAPGGAGRSKLYASVGTYYLPVAAWPGILWAGALTMDQTWYAFDGEVAADGSPVALGEQLAHNVFADGVTPDPREVTADNFEPMAQNEVNIGYERWLGGDWSVNVRGVARWFDEIIEDFSIYEGMWSTYGVECLNPELIGTESYCWNGMRVGNPGRDFEGWFDVDGDGELDRVSVPSDALGYPEPERTYYAVELGASRRFADHWMLTGWYTWSHLYGNYEGVISDEDVDAGANGTRAFDYPYAMEHSSGDLPGDIRHNLKLYGAYAWDFGLQAGGRVSFHTGAPIDSFGRHPSDPWAAATNYPSFYTGGEPRPRGCCGRTDDALWFDLLLKYDFSAVGLGWNVRLDAFNILNSHDVLRVENMAETPANGVARDDYGEPRTFQTARTVRLGLGVSF
ncbi:MAG: hypothetical protein C3F15_16610 [Holophagae bacterium]|nr:MAG: hypothetical protein C3F15_16610 [Holophagae bacterium]